MDELLNILYEDGELLVVNKPAGLVCHPTKGNARSSLIGRSRLYLGNDAKIHLLNRLDRETSGMVLFAKTDLAAKEIRGVFEARLVEKCYEAIVVGWPAEERGEIADPIGRDSTSEVAIKRAVATDGAPARTGFKVSRRFKRDEGRFALLEVFPQTGRTHQIRVHLSHYGYPIVGDKIYGGDERLYLDFVARRLSDEQRARLLLPCQALHARTLEFEWRGKTWRFAAGAEAWFTKFAAGDDLPGDWAERFV